MRMDLDASPKDVHQSLPLQVFGVGAESEPVTTIDLCAVFVLRLLDLTSLVVSVEHR